MKIIIIGAGWYGLHIYNFIFKNYKQCEILILEKQNTIFDNSSNYNQNRLHLGYHYPRCDKTRKMCLKGYKKFVEKYEHVIDDIDKNYYCISNNSIIDYNTYKKIFDGGEYVHTFLQNTFLENIDGKIIKTNEKIINSDKAFLHFKNTINSCNIKLNYKVVKIENTNSKIIINDELKCDLLIDCTYNQLQLSTKKYIYEKSLSLIYKRKKNEKLFDSLTIMDGPFFSIFPRDVKNKLYTLTHVKYTPLIISEKLEDVLSFIPTNVENIKLIIEEGVIKYYKDFLEDFEYIDYFVSYKCKTISSNDSRKCNIECINNNIITVNCGKILGIFKFEKYVNKFMKSFKT